MDNVKAVILAGGKGTRMKSELPKVLHKVYDRCIIDYVCDSCRKAGINDLSIIVGHKYEQVIEHVGRDNANFFVQKEQLGTGHAVMQAKDNIKEDDLVIVVNGDMPLISSFTIKSFISSLQLGNFDGALASAKYENPRNYGRIVRDSQGNFSKIVEHKDCNEEELDIDEINVGLYCFKGKYLLDSFSKLNNKNAQKEYYITDIPYYIMNAGGKVGVYMIQDPDETQGINSRSDLSIATNTLLRSTREDHMDNGVTLIDPSNTYISLDVEIGKDTIIYPGTNIQGKTKIGEGCIIGPNSTIVSSNIGNNVVVETSKITDSTIADNAKIGPFAHIRPKSNIGEYSKIGSFVETKNVNVGTNSKVPHLSYIGDSDVGNNVEIACGVITSNMNTKWEKNRTVIKDNAFIGCNSVLIAPIIVEEFGVVGAGSTISKDVASKSLALTRAELKTKENYYNGRIK